MAGGKGIHIFIPKYFLLLLKIPSVVWSHGKRWNLNPSSIQLEIEQFFAKVALLAERFVFRRNCSLARKPKHCNELFIN